VVLKAGGKLACLKSGSFVILLNSGVILDES
jgi:hypothetical protein